MSKTVSSLPLSDSTKSAVTPNVSFTSAGFFQAASLVRRIHLFTDFSALARRGLEARNRFRRVSLMILIPLGTFCTHIDRKSIRLYYPGPPGPPIGPPPKCGFGGFWCLAWNCCREDVSVFRKRGAWPAGMKTRADTALVG